MSAKRDAYESEEEIVDDADLDEDEIKRRALVAERGKRALVADYGRVDDEDERLTRDILRVLDGAIVATLAQANANEIDGVQDAVVVGGRAINVYLPPDYRLPSIDWDVHVAGGRTAEEHARAQESLARAMLENVRDVADKEQTRLRRLGELNRGRHPVAYGWSRSPTVTINERTGRRFRLVRVYAVVQKGRTGGKKQTLPLVDIVPTFGKEDELGAYEFAGVRFGSPVTLIDTLRFLSTLKGYHKRKRSAVRLALFEEAIADDRLSCNFYRARVERGNAPPADAQRLLQCARDIAFGAQDPLVLQLAAAQPRPGGFLASLFGLTPALASPYDNRARFVANPKDLEAHDAYIRALGDAERQSLVDYLGGESVWYNRWLRNHSDQRRVRLPQEVAALQCALTSAPPLRSAMRVYRVERYVPLLTPTGRRRTVVPDNYTLERGDLLPQFSFASTSLDRLMNFTTRFLDPFADCCAYVIDVPAGSRGALWCRSIAPYPEQSEVLLAFDSALRVVDVVEHALIAYTDQPVARVDRIAAIQPNVLYNTVRLYHCEYVEPPAYAARQTCAKAEDE